MALHQTPPARPGVRRRHQHPTRWGVAMCALALVTSSLWLSISPAGAQVSASGTMIDLPAAASAPSTGGHFVGGVADAMPKVPDHTQNGNAGALKMPTHPLVMHPVMPSLPEIPAPHTISTAVTTGALTGALNQAHARDVAQVNAAPSQIRPQSAIVIPATYAANRPETDTPSPGLLPPPRIDPSIGTSTSVMPTASVMPVSGAMPTPRATPTSGAMPVAAVQTPPSTGAQNDDAIRASAEQFLRQQTAGLPGQVGIAVTAVAPRGLATCDSLETFLPPGAHLWGRTTVGVRCIGAHPWTLYLQALISVRATYFVASHDIDANQVIAASDLAPREGDLTNLPRSVVTDLSQIVGKASLERINAGLLLRQDMARTISTIQAGQSVKLEVQGAGFSISYEGSAVNSAATGETVRVRTPSGQVVSGVVKDRDTVEVPL